MKTTDNDALLGLAKLAAMIGSIFFGGWVMGQLWAWHVTPVFAIPAPSLGHCIGLSTFAALLTKQYNDAEDEAKYWFYLLTWPLFALLLGWLAK